MREFDLTSPVGAARRCLRGLVHRTGEEGFVVDAWRLRVLMAGWSSRARRLAYSRADYACCSARAIALVTASSPATTRCHRRFVAALGHAFSVHGFQGSRLVRAGLRARHRVTMDDAAFVAPIVGFLTLGSFPHPRTLEDAASAMRTGPNERRSFAS